MSNVRESAKCTNLSTGRPFSAALYRTAACGFLEKIGSTYALVDGDAPIFDPAGPHASSLGFSDVAVSFGRMAQMVEVLRTDTPLAAAGSGGEATAAERERFLRYLHSRSLDGADEVAELLAPARPTALVDLGCGLGTYTAALLRRLPDASGVLVDRPNAAPAVTAFFAEEGLAGRTRFHGGDFLADDFGGGFDLALAGNLIHNLGEADSRALLRRLFHRVVPGGRVAIKDIAVSDDRLAPASAGRFAVSMAMFTDGGGVFPASEAAAWLVDAGFEHASTVDLVRARGAYLVVGRRP